MINFLAGAILACCVGIVLWLIWPRIRFDPTTPKQPTPFPPFTTLTLADWRKSDKRVAYVNSLMTDPTFRELLGMLQNQMPRIYPLNHPTNTEEVNAAKEIIGGWQRCLETLIEAGIQLPIPANEPQEVYPNPNEQEEPE